MVGQRPVSENFVLLIQSCAKTPVTERYAERYPYPPIGLLYLCGILRLHGYRAVVMDLYLENLTKQALARRLVELRETPVLTGVSCYTDSVNEALELVGLVKRVLTGTKVVVGGAHATFMYDEIMRLCPQVDFVARFEGEALIIRLLESLRHSRALPLARIPGLVYREGEEVRVNPPGKRITHLDILPFPPYEALPECIRHMSSGGALVFVSSRGCPGVCVFCASGAFAGTKYRSHSPEWLVGLVYHYRRATGFRTFGSLDDTFTAEPDRLSRFCRYLQACDISVPWSCKSRVDHVTPRVARMLKDSRCVSVHLGVESGDDAVLRGIRKRITLRQVFRALRVLRRCGIRPDCSFMIGHHCDTPESIERTLIFATKLRHSALAYPVMAISTPFPGTPLYRCAERLGVRITMRNWSRYDLGTPVHETDQVSSAFLRRAYFFFNVTSKREGSCLPGLTGQSHERYIRWLDSELERVRQARERALAGSSRAGPVRQGGTQDGGTRRRHQGAAFDKGGPNLRGELPGGTDLGGGLPLPDR